MSINYFYDSMVSKELRAMANANKKCKYDGEYYPAKDGVQTLKGWFGTIDNAMKWGREQSERNYQKAIKKSNAAKKKKENAERAELRERKEAIKPASKQLSEAQTSFNKYIRIRDYNESCISCGKSRAQVEFDQGWKVGGCWDAGHYMTRGAKGQLRFVLFNVKKQCKSCNAGSGKFSHKAATVGEKYRVNLIKKIGLEKVEWLENNNEPDFYKKDIEYLKRIKRIFNKKFNLYKKRFR